MKRIWTSYYAAGKQFPANAVQVQISRGAPSWWYASRKAMVWALAPNEHVWNAPKSDPNEWRVRYQEQLRQLHATGELVKLLDGIEEDSILLCWETKQEDCHRGELAEFVNERGLANLQEFPARLVERPSRVKAVTSQPATGGFRLLSRRAR